jgi:hypothetical protein
VQVLERDELRVYTRAPQDNLRDSRPAVNSKSAIARTAWPAKDDQCGENRGTSEYAPSRTTRHVLLIGPVEMLVAGLLYGFKIYAADMRTDAHEESSELASFSPPAAAILR